MDEGRKRVILIAAAILAARKLAQFEGGGHVPATIYAISDAIIRAEQILKEIDKRWPTPK
ncbi:MAG TPA: hypothetical protein VKR59_10935 [Terriglobales bacterium]|nr:hypothetical protein [Terriglobales bacterium]